MLSLIIFISCYILFIVFPDWKAWVACAGALALILTGELSPLNAFQEVHWNVMGLFVGTLILAELFMFSRMPAVMAEWLVDHVKTVRWALMAIFMLTSVISMFVENVAVVLLIAPVALSLCQKLNLSPVRPLVFLAMFSNLQGTATLIGDPPSMILGSYMKMNFLDFFFYHGRPSIFFVVQVGAVCASAFAFYLFRHYKQPAELISVEKVRSWVPTLLLVVLIGLLATSSGIDPDSIWLAGTAAMGLGLIGLIWNAWGPQWESTKTILRSLDWRTTFFLLSLFIIVAAVRAEGWLDLLANWIAQHASTHLLGIFIFIILFSIGISAFIDNVPYLLAMIPVVQEVVDRTGFSLPLLIFALLIGACLGGNITPIGASANIVAVSFLEKNQHRISFFSYVLLGLAFTLAAVIPASLFLWFIWA